MATKALIVKLTPRQHEGRAVNAVADLLRRTLRVPNIYLEPPSSIIAADVLAVDSGGAGDLHAVEVKVDELKHRTGRLYVSAQQQRLWRDQLRAIHRRLMSLPVHFRYLAVPIGSFENLSVALNEFGAFSEDGMGRLAVITLEPDENGMPKAELATPPERFRVDGTKLRRLEAKLLKLIPDIEVRI